MRNDTNLNPTLGEQETAQALIELLNESAERLDYATLSKLASARQQATSVLAERTQIAPMLDGGFSGVLRFFSHHIHQHRFMAPAAMVCSAMLVAFIATQQFSGQEVVGKGDAFLLGSDLPPEAYFDKGFDTWLAYSSQQ